MLSQTEAVILNYTKYSDSSIIVHTLTEKYGRQTLLVYGIGAGKRNSLSSFHPLSILDTRIYYKPTATLQKLKEFKPVAPLFSLSQNVYKSAMALFIADVIYRAVREEFADERLFSFIKTAILVLEEMQNGIAYFHLVFLTKLARYMGFMPDELTAYSYYDYKENHASQNKPGHPFFISRMELQQLITFLNTPFTALHIFSIPNLERMRLLESVVKMYELHLLNFNSLKSFGVLKEVFSD